MQKNLNLQLFHQLYEKNRSMMSFDKMLNLYYWAAFVIHEKVEGDFVELGSYKGYTAIMLQKLLEDASSLKSLSIYDSFLGLPDKNKEDLLPSMANTNKRAFLDNRRIQKGWFHSLKETVIENFKEFHVKLPHIYEGWFEDTLKNHLPQKIAFAHIDSDFYESTYCALTHIFPKLSPNGIIILDDYCDPEISKVNNSLPGVKKACDEYFKDSSIKIRILPTVPNQHQAIFVNDIG